MRASVSERHAGYCKMNTILQKEFTVERDDYANAGRVSSAIKTTLRQVGVDPKVMRRIAVAAYEAEINMIIHAWGGKVYLDVTEEGMIHLIFQDVGPGIPDLEKALTPGWSTANKKARELGFGAGMGLPNIQRVADEFSIESSPEGTSVYLTFRVEE